MKRLVVFSSGRGSDFQAIVDHIQLGVLEGVELAGLICNHENSPVMEKARAARVDVFQFDGVSGKKFDSSAEREMARQSFDTKCLEVARNCRADFAVLAGFDQLLTSEFIRVFQRMITNIHPAYDVVRFGGKNMVGKRVHELVMSAGERYSGCTVHLVTSIVDQGPAILKKKVPVLPSDDANSLAERILIWEHLTYPKALQLVVDDRVLLGQSADRCYVDRYSDNWDIEWWDRQKRYIESHREVEKLLAQD